MRIRRQIGPQPGQRLLLALPVVDTLEADHPSVRIQLGPGGDLG